MRCDEAAPLDRAVPQLTVAASPAGVGNSEAWGCCVLTIVLCVLILTL